MDSYVLLIFAWILGVGAGVLSVVTICFMCKMWKFRIPSIGDTKEEKAQLIKDNQTKIVFVHEATIGTLPTLLGAVEVMIGCCFIIYQ